MLVACGVRDEWVFRKGRTPRIVAGWAPSMGDRKSVAQPPWDALRPTTNTVPVSYGLAAHDGDGCDTHNDAGIS
jgi:hypothetical protein